MHFRIYVRFSRNKREKENEKSQVPQTEEGSIAESAVIRRYSPESRRRRQ